MTEADIQSLYRHRFSERDKAAKSRVWAVVVRAFFQKWVRPQDTVVDLGCGYGEFLNHVRCARRIGVDLNPDAPRHLHSGIEFHAGSVCEIPFLPDGCADVVFTSNVIEHLPDKQHVSRMIGEALRILKPGGHFILVGPNVRCIPGAYWDFWDHVVPISDRSLVEVLGSLGFEIADCHARFLPYTTRSAIPKAPLLIGAYLKFPPIWRLMGSQFLVRARKPARDKDGDVP